jgi:hypothetical protein
MNRTQRPPAPDVIPFDPLGRIAAHAAQPYPAPVPTERDLRDHWAAHYRQLARSLPPEQVDDELALARQGLAQNDDPSMGWTTAQRRARAARLEAKVAVFAAEVEWRRATGGAS